MKRAIFLALLLSLSNPTWAANWVAISSDVTGSITYLDVSSLYESPEGYVMYWAKHLFKNVHNTPDADVKFNGQKVWFSVVLTGEDCKNNLTSETAAQYVHYGLQNQVISSGTSHLRMAQPIPETTGELNHKYVCAFWDKFGRQD